MTVWIEADLCNGCKKCISVCPYDAVKLTDAKGQILERCTSCGACLEVCRQMAILTDVKPRVIPDFKDRKGVWVFAEQREGRLHPVSLELLGKAQELAADLDQGVSALLLGYKISDLSKVLIEHGADKVYLAEHTAMAEYRTETYTHILHELVMLHKPNILLLGATHIGRDLAPRLARRVETGLTADCTDLRIDPAENILFQTRPAFGGNIMATIVNRYSRPQMATVRPGVMEVSPITNNKGQVVKHRVLISENEIGSKVLEIVKQPKKRANLSEAKVIVAGGRGVRNMKGFEMLQKLANLIGGEVAATRVAVEEGWISADRQVGQTGQTVRPELYIACGISGAIQHRAGMMNSKYVVAINKDPGAPIMQIADWGVIGDLYKVVPEMIEKLKGSS